MAIEQRYFIELTYDGTRYHGWQVQQNAISVQELLNKTLTTLLRQPVETIGCGRTDTGVHAKEYFAHFDGPKTSMENHQFETSLNAMLPQDIGVKKVFAVAADAHARFDATSRSYEYHIHFRKDPFLYGYSWLLREVPHMELMNKAAAIIMEYTDFSCFSKSNTQVKTNNCKIIHAGWQQTVNGIVFNITADRFLRNMVRAIVGTLLQVGRKEIAPEGVRNIIDSKNRGSAGMSVPASGLYLTKVRYPYL